MQKNCLVYIFILFNLNAFSQITKTDDLIKSLQTKNKDTVGWAHGGVFTFGSNEGFLHNWSAGGELASITINSIFSGHIDYLHHRAIWSNNLDMAYGLNYAYSTGFLPHKTDDRIDFTSKYGYRIDTHKNIYFTGLGNFKSQFTKGYNYTLPNWDSFSTSKFFSPAYITLAIGMEYRKGSDVSLFLSPVSGRVTLADRYYTIQSPQGAFGIPYGKTSYYQFGAYFSGRYLFHINKHALFKTRVDLYCDYLAKDTKDSIGNIIKRDNPANISVMFDNLFSYKISKYFSLTLGAVFIYDNNIPYTKYTSTTSTTTKDDPGKDIGWLQIKQTFTIGLEYKF